MAKSSSSVMSSEVFTPGPLICIWYLPPVEVGLVVKLRNVMLGFGAGIMVCSNSKWGAAAPVSESSSLVVGLGNS